MRIMITGAAGATGRALSERLELAGHRVFRLDSRPSLDTDLLIDLRDPASVAAAFEVARPDVVVHVVPPVAAGGDLITVGARHVIAAARRFGVRLVLSNSSAAACVEEVVAGIIEEILGAAKPVRPSLVGSFAS